MHDTDYMTLALQLAKAAQGQTSPNPVVGAVLVKDGQIVGLGSHLFAGQEHAEIHAINMAGKRAKGATLYVTLEPCVHFGKTPPCTNAVIAAGVELVVVATLDLNPEVAGKGVKSLQDAGIKVKVGLLEDEAKQLNQAFFYNIQTKTPYITLKAGMSLDGKLATTSGESKWITSTASRADAHNYRHNNDAILVGIGTVLADNPSLTTRLPGGGKNPVRVVLDTHLRTPLDSTIITDYISPTWIFTGSDVDEKRVANFAVFDKVQIIVMPLPVLDLKAVMAKLAEMGITTILVEGGNTVLSSFLDAKLLNQLVLYISPMLIGGKDAPTFFAGNGFAALNDCLNLEFNSVQRLDNDIKIVARIR